MDRTAPARPGPSPATDTAGKDIPAGDESTQLEQLRARVAAQETALHDALTRALATEKLRTERDLAQARVVALRDVLAQVAKTLQSRGEGPTDGALLARIAGIVGRAADGGEQA